MKFIKKTILALICTGLLASGFGSIQGQKPPDRRTTRENILTLMLLRMTRVLDLNEAQTAQLFPMVNRIEKEKFVLNRQIGERLRDLRILLQKEDGNPEKLQMLMSDILNLRDKVKAKDEEVQVWVDENLTLVQQAKFLIFFQDFNQYLREKLLEARQRPPDNPVKRSPKK